jgi:hypothetical protein
MSKKKTPLPGMDIGIDAKQREKIAKGLIGPAGRQLHAVPDDAQFSLERDWSTVQQLALMFMGQYTEQWNALDIIAERIRALGFRPPVLTRSTSSGVHQRGGGRAKSNRDDPAPCSGARSDSTHRAKAVSGG